MIKSALVPTGPEIPQNYTSEDGESQQDEQMLSNSSGAASEHGDLFHLESETGHQLEKQGTAPMLKESGQKLARKSNPGGLDFKTAFCLFQRTG